ncbi:hypothetical protein TNCV_4861351 [Trichonephila clavipes]|nr:hypothetical protein TNCV_4861351 [Trichonephila clavipes]
MGYSRYGLHLGIPDSNPRSFYLETSSLTYQLFVEVHTQNPKVFGCDFGMMRRNVFRAQIYFYPREIATSKLALSARNLSLCPLQPYNLKHQTNLVPVLENAMANAFWVSVRSNISKRWNTTENDVSKNQSSDDSAIRLPNTSILNSNAADITEYFLDVPNYIILNIL